MPTIKQLQSSKNICDLLTDEQLNRISSDILQGYEIDERSRDEWRGVIDEAMKIAKQVMEPKNTPWKDASNIKYPLITQAAIKFASREFPEIVKDNQVVKSHIVARESDQLQQYKAKNVAKYMSYQLLYESDEWITETDRLLHVLPVLGTVFKKVQFDTYKRRLKTELCLPDKIVVNQNTTCLSEARRITHLMVAHKNDIVEKIRRGMYRDIDLDNLHMDIGDENDPDPGVELLQQHCYLDLDEDGYSEPYIVTLIKNTQQILRIINRFESIEKNKKGQIVCIEPENYFIDYHFIRSPDGSFYSVGFGTMLYPINEAINSATNQLMDAGTLNNSIGGLLAKGVRIKEGHLEVELNKFKQVDCLPEDLQKGVYQWQTKDPSPVLFQLLGLLIDQGKDLASTTDMMQGSEPNQNVPATTALVSIENGMKDFNAIHKRIFHALQKEFKRIFYLNKMNVTNSEYREILNDEMATVNLDFDIADKDIIPVADPFMASDSQRLVKAQAVMQVQGLVPREQLRFYLESLKLDQDQIDVLLGPEPDPNAPPPPEVMKLMADIEEAKARAQKTMAEIEINKDSQMVEALKVHTQISSAQVQADESAARIQKMEDDAEVNKAKVEITGHKMVNEADRKDFEATHKSEKDKMEAALKILELLAQGNIDATELEQNYNLEVQKLEAQKNKPTQS